MYVCSGGAGGGWGQLHSGVCVCGGGAGGGEGSSIRVVAAKKMGVVTCLLKTPRHFITLVGFFFFKYNVTSFWVLLFTLILLG